MNKDLQTINMSNVRWIHPGLGKTQSKIMDILEKTKELGGHIGMKLLAYLVYQPELDFSEMRGSAENPATRSQLNSVYRAVRSLKKRGLVWTDIFRCQGCYPVTSVGSIEIKRQIIEEEERKNGGNTMNKKEKDIKERERDPFGEKVFFIVGRDSEGCLSVYTPEQERGVNQVFALVQNSSNSYCWFWNPSTGQMRS